MSRTNLFPVAALLLAGLTTACGQDAATPGETETAHTGAILMAAPPAVAASVPEKTGAAAVQSLPLKHGHYVRAGTPCNQASNADRIALVSNTGMSLNCTFKRIEKIGPTTYRVTSECSDGGAAWGREESVETLTDTYEIPNDTSFKVKYEGGSENSAQFCAQVSAGEL